MKSILIMGIIVAVEAFSIWLLARLLKNEKETTKKLKEELSVQTENSKKLAEHIAEISKINSEKAKKTKKVKEAETDEEVLDIVASVVNANNNRVHNGKKNNSSTTETSKE